MTIVRCIILYEEGAGVKGVAHARALSLGGGVLEWVVVSVISRGFLTGVLRQSGRNGGQ